MAFRLNQEYACADVKAGDRLCAPIGLSAAAVMMLFFGSAAAAPGDLDPSFGSYGIVETEIAGSAAQAEALTLQPDGKIVVAGFMYPVGAGVARYLPDGRLDSSFGDGGVVTGPAVAPFAIAVQADGKILISGRSAANEIAVVRYLSNGSIDSAFGVGGVVTGPLGVARAVATQLNGRSVVAGSADDGFTGLTGRMTILRLDADGTPDSTFGTNGRVSPHIGSFSQAAGLALLPDGKIVAGGSGFDVYWRFALARFEPDGRLDPAFGNGGVVMDPVAGSNALAAAMVRDKFGRLVVAGSADRKVAVVRYLSDGRVDQTFGDQGLVTVGTGGLQGANALALQPDGRVVLAAGGPNEFVLLRLLPNGKVDPSFGEAGISRKAFGVWSGANTLVVQPEGPILAAGFVSHEEETNMALVRYRVDTPTAIHAERLVVPYGKRLTLTGTATHVDEGKRVSLVAKGCYGSSSRPAAVTTERSDGGWSADVRPRTRSAYRARIAGERSEAVIVQVRPRVAFGSSAGSVTLKVHVLFGHGLSGEWIALQRWRSGRWADIQQRELARIGRTAAGIVSGTSFRKPGPGRYRAFLQQPNPDACFADAASRAIRR